jgi:RNA polymerase sigma factor (sigma-70 family)
MGLHVHDLTGRVGWVDDGAASQPPSRSDDSARGRNYAASVAWSRRTAGPTASAAEASFEAWFRRLLPFAHNVGYRFFGGDSTLAADVAQEALTRAYVKWDRIRDHPNLEAWVTTTAFHVAMEMSRQQRRLGRASTRIADVPGEEERIADGDALARALARLSARQQQVLVWRYYFDNSVHDTAERLGMTDGQVKDATHEAMTKLDRVLGRRKDALR